MTRPKFLPASMKPRSTQIGDVVQIKWYDTHGNERVRREDINQMDEPAPTYCWGVVVRKTERYLFIASELGDPQSDGDYIEMLPYALIDECLLLAYHDMKG